MIIDYTRLTLEELILLKEDIEDKINASGYTDKLQLELNLYLELIEYKRKFENA